MKIKDIKVIPLNIPNKYTQKWESGNIQVTEHLIVRIEAEDGTFGATEAIPRPGIYGETPQSIYYAITKHLAPRIIGEDSFNLERIWEKMAGMPWNPAAKGAIDVALYDLNGKIAKLPICQLLGGPYRKEIPLSWCTLSPVYFGIDAVLEDVKQRLAEGYKAFKIKAGDPDIDTDLILRMRKICPDDVTLSPDPNMVYSREDALRVGKALEGIVDSFEEPLPAWDDEGRKELAQKVNIPLLSDESTFTVEDVYRQIKLGAIRRIGMKLPRTGYTLSSKIVRLAEANNMPVQVSTQAETDLGSAACAHLAAAYKRISLPCEISYFKKNVTDTLLLEGELVIENGKMIVPDGRPGMGVEIDWEKVNKYAVKL